MIQDISFGEYDLCKRERCVKCGVPIFNTSPIAIYKILSHSLAISYIFERIFLVLCKKE